MRKEPIGVTPGLVKPPPPPPPSAAPRTDGSKEYMLNDLVRLWEAACAFNQAKVEIGEWVNAKGALGELVQNNQAPGWPTYIATEAALSAAIAGAK